jgi:hypothetical protein
MPMLCFLLNLNLLCSAYPLHVFHGQPNASSQCHPSTVQIFSLKVTGIAGGLQLPLDVFGTITIRDSLDHNRNIIFCRTRDNCQSLTLQVICLFLAMLSRRRDVYECSRWRHPHRSAGFFFVESVRVTI